MNNPITPQTLEGAWLHSHEEDTPTEKVYRPDSYDFPPSRGRAGFTLRPDGLGTRHSIAPADGTHAAEETWQLNTQKAQPELILQAPSGQVQKLTVVSAAPDRLVVRQPLS